MRIAIIVKRLDVKGGTQRQALSLAQELCREGHEVTLYTLSYNKEACFTDLLEGMTVLSLPREAAAASWGEIVFARVLPPLSEFVRECRRSRDLALLISSDTEILNPHDQISYRVAAYYKGLVHKDTPSIWMMNDMPTRYWFYWRERQLNPAIRVSWLRKLLYHVFDAYDKLRFVDLQDTIVVLDTWNKAFVQRYFKRDAIVVRSGLDADKFEYSVHPPPLMSNVRLLTTGILFPHRRFEDIIEALSFLQTENINASLTIIGETNSDTGYYARLSALVEERKLRARVFFRGKVSDEELARAYREHDIFIFSNWLQTWGLAPFEAMACGMPTIVSRGAGAHEVLTHKENAYLVAPCDPLALAGAVRDLAFNPQLYAKLGREGRRFTERCISWKRYAHQMLELFNRTRHTYE